MKVGGKYNWKNQAERLVYLGYNWSGNGYWHQFAKVESPDKVWCEVTDRELPMIERSLEDYLKLENAFELPIGLGRTYSVTMVRRRDYETLAAAKADGAEYPLGDNMNREEIIAGMDFAAEACKMFDSNYGGVDYYVAEV